jgi:hypothetical protein
MKGATTLALFAIVPPPFPFTAVVLAAGALEADALRFLGVTAGVRLVRFGAEAVLAAIYGGRSVLRWMNSDTVQDVVAGIIVLAAVGSVISLFALRRRSTIPYSASRPQYRSP